MFSSERSRSRSVFSSPRTSASSFAVHGFSSALTASFAAFLVAGALSAAALVVAAFGEVFLVALSGAWVTVAFFAGVFADAFRAGADVPLLAAAFFVTAVVFVAPEPVALTVLLDFLIAVVAAFASAVAGVLAGALAEVFAGALAGVFFAVAFCGAAHLLDLVAGFFAE